MTRRKIQICEKARKNLKKLKNIKKSFTELENRFTPRKLASIK